MEIPQNCLVSNDVTLGEDVSLIGFCNLYGCSIGDNSFVEPFVEIQNNVLIGNKVKIQSHAFLCSGVSIEDEVFIGHGVVFTNDKFPRSTNQYGEIKGNKDWGCENTLIKKRASIGSNATILCGIVVGENSIIGAGSVVVNNIPANAIAAGNPATIIRYLE